MSGYVEAGYALALGAVAGYSAWVTQRRRSLARQLPPREDGGTENGGR